MEMKHILILANSVKRHARCVAGREVFEDGRHAGWIRPIGTGEEHALLFAEQAYEDQTSPQLLDIVAVPLAEAQPLVYQPENWLIDVTRRWTRVAQASFEYAERLVENPPVLFLNGGSSGGGLNDEIPAERGHEVAASLCLIDVANMTVEVERNRWTGGLDVRGRFSHNRMTYLLKITDPRTHDEFLARGEGEYPLGRCLVCVSLTGPMLKRSDGRYYHYKLIAGIVRPA
ncbi:dual OB domain-containing protein [Paraburkholderia bannensis]|uniref:dual OB domain-containing protein n=1 Tax=Paraburkholderia bannensis TaxID=765414 RepID=UPI002AC35B53|nr:hypothetical protein [Paraburkholderia bannensis]